MNKAPFIASRLHVLFVIGNYQSDFSIYGVFSEKKDFERALREAQECENITQVCETPVIMTTDQIKDQLVSERLVKLHLHEADKAFKSAAFPKGQLEN